MKYVNGDKTKRIHVKYLDENNQELFKVENRTAMDVGELFSEKILNNIIETTLPQSKQPDCVRMLILVDYFREE